MCNWWGWGRNVSTQQIANHGTSSGGLAKQLQDPIRWLVAHCLSYGRGKTKEKFTYDPFYSSKKESAEDIGEFGHKGEVADRIRLRIFCYIRAIRNGVR